MKYILTLLFFFGLGIHNIDAQTFQVYSLEGSVDSLDHRGKVKSQIYFKQVLDSTTCIKVNEGSTITLLHEQNQRLYTINKPVKGEIGKLINQKQECTVKNLSKRYLTYLLSRMTQSKSAMPRQVAQNRMGKSTNAFRGNGKDSLACDSTMCDSTICDSTMCDSLLKQ